MALPDYTNRQPPAKAPPLASLGDTVPLYHYGALTPDADGRLVVDPGRFGEKEWTRAERKATPEPKRSFFYTQPDPRERFFEGQRRYVTAVPKKHLYDLTADPDGLVKKHGLEATLSHLQSAGYHGVYYGEYPPAIVAVWRPTEVKEDTRVSLAMKAPAGGMVSNNLFVRGGRFVAKPLSRVAAVMQRLRERRVKLARKRSGPLEKELKPWVASVAQMPEDKVRRGAVADWLLEHGHHHSEDDIRRLWEHDGPVFLTRHPASGKVVSVPGSPVRTTGALRTLRRRLYGVGDPNSFADWLGGAPDHAAVVHGPRG